MISGISHIDTIMNTKEKDNDNVLTRFSFRNDEVTIQEVQEVEEQDLDLSSFDDNKFFQKRNAAYTIGTTNYNSD